MATSSWFTTVGFYCERTGPQFWAEPLNAVTNAAFLIAAVAAFANWRAAGSQDRPVLPLIGLVLLIATGSFLFHTLATRWAALADTLPIVAFIYGYLVLALTRFLRLPLWAALAVLLGFIAVSYGLPRLMPGALRGGSAHYVPALCAMLAIGWLARRGPAGRGLLIAGGVFAVSLTFRSIDRTICDAFPQGTHFLWHVLNAVVLYLLLRTAIRFGRAAPG